MSSHQVEGGNSNNDWYAWEEAGKTLGRSGKATDYWNKYQQDNAIAQDLGCSAFRFSLEWSRIEPADGEFNKEAIEHYRNVLQDLKTKGMQRVVTLCHWTLPLWFAQKGGWHGKNPEKDFVRYCEFVIKELGDEIDILITLNEPTIPLNKGYLAGVFPPGKKSIAAFWTARNNMIKAHSECYKLVKNIKPELPVGITQFCNTFETAGVLRIFNGLAKKFEVFYNWGFVKKSLDFHDFVGVDYYATFVFSLKYPFIARKTTMDRWTDMNWGIYPQGLYDVCMEAQSEFQKPIYIFENGLADANDKHRKDFIRDHLMFLHKAIDGGADVRGYFYWSLTDNFEWNKAFEPRFGLVEINYETLERKIRPSALEYAKICKNNELELG